MNGENILDKICHTMNDEFYFNYSTFKQFANTTNAFDPFEVVTDHMVRTLSKLLEKRELFVFHFDVKGLSVKDVDKYYNYCVRSSIIMSEKFPDKLQQCYVYNACELFKMLYSGFSLFLSKRTRDKFHFTDTK